MPYSLNNFDGRSFTTIEDGVVDRQLSSSLNFVGKDVTGYGEIQNENFLFLLENFAGQNAPVNKLQGQIWFDKNVSVMKPKVWDGTQWKTFSMIAAQSTEPGYAQLGDMWFDVDTEQLYVKTTSSFALIGPEKISGFATTQLKSVSVLDSSSVAHACIVMYADGTIIGVISSDSFNVKSTEAIYSAGITHVGNGMTFRTGSSVSTDTPYAANTGNETITGSWTFNNTEGISITSSRIYTTSSNLVLDSLSDLVIKASNILPYGTTVLGSANNKFSKVFTSELSGGTSISSVNMTGQFVLGASSKISPATDGGIALGANNARWSSVFAKAINAGGSASTGDIIGQWTLDGNSTIDATQGTFKTDTLSAGYATTTGTITGAWKFTDDSSLTFETGSLTLQTGDVNVTSGSVKTKEITSGDISTAGIITGNWSLYSGSQLDASQASFKSRSLNAGSAATTATITGAWSLLGTSGLKFDTGVLDVTNGTIYSKIISTGGSTVNGTITGRWLYDSGSSIDIGNGTFYSKSLNSGLATNSATITGNWILQPGSTLDTSQGTFKTTSLNAGSSSTAGTIIGNWTVGTGSTFTTQTLNAGSTSTTGTITGNWNLSAGSRLRSTYADLAEYYSSDIEYEPGTVVSIVREDTHDVSISSMSNDQAVAGIVTTNPAYIMNSKLEGTKVCIALAGRVPCKAIGPISKGDLLVTSSMPGHAKVCSNYGLGTLIGKSLGKLADGEIGIIEVMVVRG
jgi:hypothetical protein